MTRLFGERKTGPPKAIVRISDTCIGACKVACQRVRPPRSSIASQKASAKRGSVAAMGGHLSPSNQKACRCRNRKRIDRDGVHGLTVKAARHGVGELNLATLAGLLIGQKIHNERTQQIAAHNIEVGGSRLGSRLLHQSADAPTAPGSASATSSQPCRAHTVARDHAIARNLIRSAGSDSNNGSATVLGRDRKHLVADVAIGHHVIAQQTRKFSPATASAAERMVWPRPRHILIAEWRHVLPALATASAYWLFRAFAQKVSRGSDRAGSNSAVARASRRGDDDDTVDFRGQAPRRRTG